MKRSGRPPVRGRPRESPGTVLLGVDLGATKVVAGLVAPNGRVLRRSGRFVHANDGPAGVIEAVAASVRSCLGPATPRPAGLGIAVAAQVEPATATVVHAPNLRWRDVPLGRRLAEELDLPVSVLNDARAAALGEWRFGAGRGTDDLFLLSLGTGVGGSAVVGGRLLEGGTHALGEVGHLTLVAGGRACHCPNRGCFEAYVGGWAIAERAQEAVAARPGARADLLHRAGTLRNITAETVFAAARAGDRLAGEVVRETEAYLADGAVGVVNAFNPSLLVLTGGLVAGRPELLARVEEAVRARCQPPAARARVAMAQLGENAALVGAAEWARSPGA